jgi:hypothetical protein
VDIQLRTVGPQFVEDQYCHGLLVLVIQARRAVLRRALLLTGAKRHGGPPGEMATPNQRVKVAAECP